ncbi:MAG: DnaJ C-terminal domain-containing protein [bacterium]
MKKDYYAVLGLSKSAGVAQIKKAYRELARKHHPDVDKSTGAEQRFKEINEAYQVLSDPKKKATYDQFGHAAFSQGGGANGFSGRDPFSGFRQRPGGFQWSYSTGGDPSAGAGFEDLGDIFSSFFGGGFARGPRRGRDLYYTLAVDFMDAVRGMERAITFNGKRLKVKIPAGIRAGAKLRFKGEGESSPNNGPKGDLILQIHINPHRKFIRREDDIFSVEEVSFIVAILGASLPVETVKGVVRLKVPSGTQPGTEFKIRGKGAPHLRARGNGDHFVKVRVTIPKRLSKKERELLEEYKKFSL